MFRSFHSILVRSHKNHQGRPEAKGATVPGNCDQAAIGPTTGAATIHGVASLLQPDHPTLANPNAPTRTIHGKSDALLRKSARGLAEPSNAPGAHGVGKDPVVDPAITDLETRGPRQAGTSLTGGARRTTTTAASG